MADLHPARLSLRRRMLRRTMTPSVARAGLFTVVGVAFLAYWLVADPSYEMTETMQDWRFELGFSAAILTLAVALPVFAQLVGGRLVWRMSLIAAGGAALSSLANIVEDGLRMTWAFWGLSSG